MTVLGAILTGRASAASGSELHRYLEGYQFSLVVAAVLVAIGVPVSLYMLRRSGTVRPAAEERVLEAV